MDYNDRRSRDPDDPSRKDIAIPSNTEVLAAVREHIALAAGRVATLLNGRRGVPEFARVALTIYECENYIRAASFETELIATDVDRVGVLYEGQRQHLNILVEYVTYAEEDVIALLSVDD